MSWAMASSASSRPTSYAVSVLQAADSRVALGNRVTLRPPENFSPRTPVGPSERLIGASPILSLPAMVKTAEPVSRATFSARESWARRSSYDSVLAGSSRLVKVLLPVSSCTCK